MRCVIVDDEELSRVHLKQQCQRIDELEVVAVFADALDAYQYLQEEDVDLVFLDIEMPDFSGIDLVKQLDNPPAIIFITSKEGYALETYDFIETVVDYILKPVTLPRLLKAIQRYKKAYQPSPDRYFPEKNSENSSIVPTKNEQFLFVKSERKYVRIDLRELLYVETVGDYSIFKTNSDQHIVHATLKSVAERLQHPHFFKVHRSYIVNISKIRDIEDSNLLIDDKVIPISRNHRNALMERIAPL